MPEKPNVGDIVVYNTEEGVTCEMGIVMAIGMGGLIRVVNGDIRKNVPISSIEYTFKGTEETMKIVEKKRKK